VLLNNKMSETSWERVVKIVQRMNAENITLRRREGKNEIHRISYSLRRRRQLCHRRQVGGGWRVAVQPNTTTTVHSCSELCTGAERTHPTVDGVPTQQVGPPATTAEGKTAGYYYNIAPAFEGPRLSGSQNCCARVDETKSLYYYFVSPTTPSPVNMRSALLASKMYVGTINRESKYLRWQYEKCLSSNT